MSDTGRNVVFLSAFHDYRTAKRGSIQQVADGLVELGYNVSFISTRYSYLSKITGDSRLFLWDKANWVESVNDIDCFLWRTSVHPFQSRNKVINAISARLYPRYSELPSRQFDRFIREADYVILESSVAAIFMRRIKRLNPDVKIIYYATDRLDTVGAHPFIRERLEADVDLIHHICLRSPKMMSDFQWAAGKLYRAEFGIDADDFASVGANPYRSGRRAAISVGSMLFDPTFFQRAAAHFPDVDFHVIGCGATFEAPANVLIHPEMKFVDTLPYVKYAAIGVAPYRPAPGVEYLAESSLKLAQYEYFALPAVCPSFAAGDVASRFGYEPNDEASICEAVSRALGAAGTFAPRTFLSWKEVAERVVHPEQHSGSKIG
ncbi:glycosyltransferase family 1 protein [Altericroceibacterium xinjiangense]|uniref:GumK N-terminal domain-containing glycosyltransferase n=1 Tax=Altericroceibacterium xinjiangense TaxID=762261 RepID=UPI000F7E908C|nr:glycosyltransferase family 1 protein [Altericroceibacterium xinjiangense]